MIKGNILKFGYGDISVGSTGWFQELTFRGFKPPKEVGEIFRCGEDDSEFVTDLIKIKLTLDECMDFKETLKNLTTSNCVVEYKEYVFDFTNYNKKSIDVVIRHLNGIIFVNMMCLAC